MAQLGQQAISLSGGLALSSEERQTGQSIASQLESVMRDTSRSSSAASGLIIGPHPDFPHIPPEPRYHDLDCVLVLDSSGSIGRSKFEQAKRATKVSTKQTDLPSCQPWVTVTSCFVYKVIRVLESIDHLCINPIHRIGLIHK